MIPIRASVLISRPLVSSGLPVAESLPALSKFARDAVCSYSTKPENPATAQTTTEEKGSPPPADAEAPANGRGNGPLKRFITKQRRRFGDSFRQYVKSHRPRKMTMQKLDFEDRRTDMDALHDRQVEAKSDPQAPMMRKTFGTMIDVKKMEAAPSARISGYGRFSGGVFNTLKLEGAGKFTGDVAARALKLLGTFTLSGTVDAQKLSIDGTSRVSGAIRCSSWCKFKGSHHLRGALSAPNIYMAGQIRADSAAEIECRDMEASGTLKFSGPVQCSSFSMTMWGRSNIEHIDASDKIRIQGGMKFRNGSWLQNLFRPGNRQKRAEESTAKKSESNESVEAENEREMESEGAESGRERERERESGSGRAMGGGFGGVRLYANLLEAPDIAIEYTTAREVRGECVHVGRGCVVDTVLYQRSLTIDQSAVVKDSVQCTLNGPSAK